MPKKKEGVELPEYNVNGTKRKKIDSLGRPNYGGPTPKIDEEKVEAMAQLMCTNEEISAVLKCSIDVLSEPRYAEIIKRGRANAKQSLRRLQWRTAITGNANMQIFLGKAYLDQREGLFVQVKDSDVKELQDLTRNPLNPDEE